MGDELTAHGQCGGWRRRRRLPQAPLGALLKRWFLHLPWARAQRQAASSTRRRPSISGVLSSSRYLCQEWALEVERRLE